MSLCDCCDFFFFNDTATSNIFTLSLHDALPISLCRAERIRGVALVGVDLEQRAAVDDRAVHRVVALRVVGVHGVTRIRREADRKSTRLNSSHANISYAVFCLKKKQQAQ